MREALLWTLEFGSKREFLEDMQDRGEEVPALDREPMLGEDQQRQLANYLILHKTRPMGFEDLAPLEFPAIAAMHESEGWREAGLTLAEYADLMVELDESLRSYHKERKPRRPNRNA